MKNYIVRERKELMGKVAWQGLKKTGNKDFTRGQRSSRVFCL